MFAGVVATTARISASVTSRTTGITVVGRIGCGTAVTTGNSVVADTDVLVAAIVLVGAAITLVADVGCGTVITGGNTT